jgi:hypothetical protein
MPAPDPTTSPSPAQRAADERADAARAVIAASATATTAALPRVRHLLPEGWHASGHQTISGATHTVAIDPPTGVVDATAYVMPRTDDRDGTVSGWWVRVHNRQQRVDFPLYTDGGARVAVYTSVEDAVAAAVAALRIEAVPTVIGRPRQG